MSVGAQLPPWCILVSLDFRLHARRFQFDSLRRESNPDLSIQIFHLVPPGHNNNNKGRAQRGDRTAEDGRKTERSSAPYAEAYSPRSASTCLDLRWISFLTKKTTRVVNYQWGGSIARGRSVRVCKSTASVALKMFLSL